MKEYFTRIRHQSAVQRLGTRDLYLRVIYSHILGFTQAEGYWQGTHLEMAGQLELTKSQITKSMNKLIGAGLVRKQGTNMYIAVGANSTTAGSDSTGTGSVGTENGSEGTLPNNPLNTDSTDSTEACTHPRDAPAGQDVSFPDFCNAYRAHGGKITAQQRTDSYDLWCGMSQQKRQAVMAELGNAEGFWRSRPDWLLADYQLPPPKNYNGHPGIISAMRSQKLVCAQFRGQYGIYTLDDAKAFNMHIARGINFQYQTSDEQSSNG